MPSDDPEWTRLKRRIWDFRSRTMWHIGTVYKVPIYDLVGNHVKNFPKLPWYGWSTGAYVLTEPQQWYFDDE